MLFLDELFKMSDGYVLNFSDRTMAVFFAEKLNIDIDDLTYSRNGSSKAKRLRCFLTEVPCGQAYRYSHPQCPLGISSNPPGAISTARDFDECTWGMLFLALINRLRSENDSPPFGGIKPNQALDRAGVFRIFGLNSAQFISSRLNSEVSHLRNFLKQLFDLYKLEARDAFRLRGEQIDGSFQFHNDTYLLEAKWQRLPCGVAELHVFHGKIEQKAAWTRGIFHQLRGV